MEIQSVNEIKYMGMRYEKYLQVFTIESADKIWAVSGTCWIGCSTRKLKSVNSNNYMAKPLYSNKTRTETIQEEIVFCDMTLKYYFLRSRLYSNLPPEIECKRCISQSRITVPKIVNVKISRSVDQNIFSKYVLIYSFFHPFNFLRIFFF